jgi:hypothetical protein
VQTDDSISPQNFNGTFTFGGGALAPVLDAQNRPLPGANGHVALARAWRRILAKYAMQNAPSAMAATGSPNANIGTPPTVIRTFPATAWAARTNAIAEKAMRKTLLATRLSALRGSSTACSGARGSTVTSTRAPSG